MKRPLRLGALLALAACGGHKPPLPSNLGVAALAAPTPLPSSALPQSRDSSPSGLEAQRLFAVPDGSIGPFLARRGDLVLGAYIGTSSEGARRVVSLPLSSAGTLRGDPKVIAPIATDATMLVVRPTGGAKPGFVAAWTSLTDRGEALSVVGVGDDGKARVEPTELARTTDDIVWVELVPTPRGALAVWAEQTHTGDVNILAAALGTDGAMRGVPSRVARGVRGWQVTPLGDGAALSLVAASTATPTAKGDKGGARGSVVSWQRLDADAHPVGGAVVVAPAAHVSGDVDAVRVGDQTLLAWTDASRPDPQPVLATVDAEGHAHGPTRAIEGGAGGTLVGLASGAAGAVLAWEEPFRRGRSSKRINLAKVDLASRTVDARAEAPLDLEGRGAPEIAGLANGFALLAPARVCLRGESCADASALPTVVRFDAKLAVAQVEPLRIGLHRDGVSAGWGLTCDSGTSCLALAVGLPAEGAAPEVMAVHVRARETSFRPPLVAPPPSGAPVVDALDTIAAGEPFADLATARLGGGTVVAMLASANDESAKRDDTAVISTRVFDPNGAAMGEGVVTRRALAAGGVAVATTDRPDDGAAIAWVARDSGDPQVHLARVDRHGKLLHDVALTAVRGDASDVAVAWTGEQWAVAWVDTRDGNGEVYATTVGRDGRGVGRGQRITNAPGDASDVALFAQPDGVGADGRGALWVAWADPRESPQEGFADIYVAPLRSRDASRASDEVRVLATAAHSRSPSLAALGKDVAVAWIEEAPMGADPSRARQYGALLAWLGPTGHPKAEPVRLPVAGDGYPTAITLDGEPQGLHALLARAGSDLVVLDGVEVTRENDGTPFALVTLDGPATLDVALGAADGALFFNDESSDGEARRVRRATVRWRR